MTEADRIVHYMGPQGALHATLDVTDFPATADWRQVTCQVCLGQSPMNTYAFPQRFMAGVPGPLPEVPEDSYAPDAEPLDLSQAEQLGILVGSAYGTALAERDKARAIAVALEQDLAQAERVLLEAEELLAAAVLRLDETTWAVDSALAGRVREFLNRSGE